jgi:hypothetical protein
MRRSILIATVAVLLALVGIAWLADAVVSGSETATYRVRVMRDGRELASFDLAELKAIGMKEVVLQGKRQTGPALSDVLARAGVADYAQVEIIGPGTDDSGHLTLKRADVGPDVMLAIANRGTAKLAGPDISTQMRVRDVTELVVR